jgi:hypothetical protein
VTPITALVIFLPIYALVGAAFAFNVRSVSDRAAEAYRRKPWLLRQIGRDNPKTWRAGGFVMLVFGIAVVAGMGVMAIWNPPVITTTTAIAVLGAVAVVAAVLLLRARLNHPANHPPEPPEAP